MRTGTRIAIERAGRRVDRRFLDLRDEVVPAITRQHARAKRGGSPDRRVTSCVSGCAVHSCAERRRCRLRARGFAEQRQSAGLTCARRWRAVEHQAAVRADGCARGEIQHHARALRHADQQRPNELELGDQRVQVCRRRAARTVRR